VEAGARQTVPAEEPLKRAAFLAGCARGAAHVAARLRERCRRRGTILSQDPAAGSQVPAGTVIGVVVSIRIVLTPPGGPVTPIGPIIR